MQVCVKFYFLNIHMVQNSKCYTIKSLFFTSCSATTHFLKLPKIFYAFKGKYVHIVLLCPYVTQMVVCHTLWPTPGCQCLVYIYVCLHKLYSIYPQEMSKLNVLLKKFLCILFCFIFSQINLDSRFIIRSIKKRDEK